MTKTLQTLLYPVTDPAAAKPIFSKLLGQEPSVDEPYYVHYQVGDLKVGLVPGGHQQGLTGPTPYWDVPDINAAVAELVEAGATVQKEPADVGGGMLVATLTDKDGNTIGLSQG